MDSILNAFRFTHQYAALLIEDLEDDEMTKLPNPGMNHPAWILGHLTIAADLAAKLLGEEMLTENSWMKAYGPGSSAVEDSTAYPSKAELFGMLSKVYDRTEGLVKAATSEQLVATNKTPFFPEQFPTVGDLLTHLLTTHASMHLGQLSAWRRCLGKNSVLGV